MDLSQATDTINIIANNLPWYLDAVIASGGLTALFHFVYKRFAVQSKILKISQIISVCMLLPTTYYLAVTPIDDPTINAFRGSLLFLGTQLWYYAIKYGRKYIAESYNKAQLLNEKKTAVLPSALAPDPSDFSQ